MIDWQDIDTAPKVNGEDLRLKGGVVMNCPDPTPEPEDGFVGEWQTMNGPASEPGWYVLIEQDGNAFYFPYARPLNWAPMA